MSLELVAHIDVSQSVISQFDALTSDIRRDLLDIPEPQFFDELEARAPNAADIIPQEAALLRTVAEHVGPRAVVLTLPPETVADVGPTPTHHRDAAAQRLLRPDIYRALLMGVSGLHAFGNAAFHGGSIHHDIIFNPDAQNSSAKNSAMRLHVDGLYVNRNSDHRPEPGKQNLNLSPDFLTLHFMRNCEQVPTMLVFPKWEELSPSTRELLWQPILRLNEALPPLSVLYGDNSEDPWVRYVTDAEYITNAKDEAAREALRELNRHLHSRQIAVPMHAGQILFFDNRRLLHGRAARSIQSLPPQTEWRWQRRVHYVNDLDRLSQPELPRRMINTDKVYRYKNSR